MLRSILLLGALLLAVSCVALATATPAPQSALGGRQTRNWEKYVRAPSSNTISPVRIVSSFTRGDVNNPEGLLNPGGDPTILTRWVPESGAQDIAPQIVVDFGQNIVGYLSINFAGAISDTDTGLPGIRLAFSESIQYGFLTDLSDFSRSNSGDTITPGSDQVAVQPQAYTWTDNHGCEYGNQVCADGLHGFRYMKIYLDALESDAPYTSVYGQVAIDSLSLNYTAFLGSPDTFSGWFESSDESLNQWYYDAVYTTDMGTAILDVDSIEPRGAASPGMLGKLLLLDGAKRDRLPYVGDLAVAARTSYLTRNVPEATRNVLTDMADHQRSDGFIPPASINGYQLELLDYPLWWVASSYDLLMYTGNTSYFNTYYQTMVNTLDTFYPSVTDPVTQLITKGVGNSGSFGDYAFIPRTGAVTYYNVLYVLALNNAASIATFLGGRDDDVARWSARAKVVSDEINNKLFDTSVGAFFDGACGSSPCQTHAQDGNSLSIVSGVADNPRSQAVLSYMATHMNRTYGNAFYDNDVVGDGYGNRVYAFISYFELEARFLSGSPDTALEEIRRLYGWMAQNDPGITAWEGIGANGQPYEGGFTSMAHGWSTGIVPALTNYVLGVIPTGPGFSTWNIKPMPGDVAWAEGQVPTPNGAISVNWDNTGLFSMSVNAPTISSGSVWVPVRNSNTPLFVNEDQVWPASQPNAYNPQYVDGYVQLQVKGGDYIFTLGEV